MRRWYRVEFRCADRVSAFGLVACVAPDASTLKGFAGRLVRDGAVGELVLIDDVTGRQVAHMTLPGPRAADPVHDPEAMGPASAP